MLGAWVSFLAFPILITFSHPINCFAAGLMHFSLKKATQTTLNTTANTSRETMNFFEKPSTNFSI
jgi:hypothetical protein